MVNVYSTCVFSYSRVVQYPVILDGMAPTWPHTWSIQCVCTRMFITRSRMCIYTHNYRAVQYPVILDGTAPT